MLTTKVEPSMHDALILLAKQRNKSVGAIVRALLRIGLKAAKPK